MYKMAIQQNLKPQLLSEQIHWRSKFEPVYFTIKFKWMDSIWTCR